MDKDCTYQKRRDTHHHLYGTFPKDFLIGTFRDDDNNEKMYVQEVSCKVPLEYDDNVNV